MRVYPRRMVSVQSFFSELPHSSSVPLQTYWTGNMQLYNCMQYASLTCLMPFLPNMDFMLNKEGITNKDARINLVTKGWIL